jgi:CubicO group peptidase (beta-lactamase class C family)
MRRVAASSAFALLLLLLLCSPLARAQQIAQPVRADVVRVVSPLVTERVVRGLVVALANERGSLVTGFGRMSDDADAGAPDGATVFGIASLTKPFVGLMLAQMCTQQGGDANRPLLSLDDPVDVCFGPGDVGVPLPRFANKPDKPITLAHLATHFSGLPWWPDNFEPGKSIVISPYSTDQLMRMMATHKLAAEPGKIYGYSNLGFMLLGEALRKRDGAASFEAMLQKRVCDELNMHDTRITLSASMRQRLTPGYTSELKLQASGPPRAGGADAGVYSTADDMLVFAQACAGLKKTSFDDAITLALASKAVVSPGFEQALGWGIDTQTGVRVKYGRSHGYRTMMLVWPAKKAAAVVLCNTDAEEINQLAPAMLSLMRGIPAEPAPRSTVKTRTIER